MKQTKEQINQMGNGSSAFKIIMVGLGLIGGSMAMALRGFKNARVIGVDVDAETRERALSCGAVDEVYANADDLVRQADLIVLSVYPHHIVEFVEKYAHQIKKGCVVTDVCGAKTKLYAKLSRIIPEDIDYIGIHPMAGKEVGGFENACKSLFNGTGFLITPLISTKKESVLMMKELARHIGATKIAVACPELHDGIVGYTSDLMHISATALCMHFHPDMTLAYTAGAFRDCTRIANINPALWTELLMANGQHILPHLDEYISYLTKMRNAMREDDNETLYELLDLSRMNNQEMLKR